MGAGGKTGSRGGYCSRLPLLRALRRAHGPGRTPAPSPAASPPTRRIPHCQQPISIEPRHTREPAFLASDHDKTSLVFSPGNLEMNLIASGVAGLAGGEKERGGRKKEGAASFESRGFSSLRGFCHGSLGERGGQETRERNVRFIESWDDRFS